jgi:hypothetical protein
LLATSGQQIGKTIRFDHVRGMVWQEMNPGNSPSPGIYYLRVIIHEKGSNKERVITSRVVIL